MLEKSLSENPKVTALGEIYTHHIEGQKKQISQPDEILKIFLRNSKRLDGKEQGCDVCFFEMKYLNILRSEGDITLMEALGALKGKLAGVIILQRDNKLKRIVSSLKAAHTQVYHQRFEGEQKQPVTQAPFVLPMTEVTDFATGVTRDNLVDLLAESIRVEEQIVGDGAELFPDALRLTYENDLEQSITPAMNKICDFVGLSAFDVEPILKKTSKGLATDISNFSEVKKLLENTPYAWMVA